MTTKPLADWKPISTIPDALKDGRRVWVKRVHERRIVKEGWAVWATSHPDSPHRAPVERDPLGRLSEADYKREADGWSVYANTPRWLNEDRMHTFPQPTHWTDISPPE